MLIHTNKVSDCSVVRLEMLEYRQRVLTNLELHANRDTKTSTSYDASTIDVSDHGQDLPAKGVHIIYE